MSRFYFGGSSSASSASDSEDDSLPYPTPLQRSDFLAPNFSPSAYLSSLHNRHQTLEDLRSELRARSQLLNKELLDLVNSNYQDFLSLGSSLKGGDEKIEEVRVGLLGFRKEVEGVRKRVVEKEEEVVKLVNEKVQIRRHIAVGRALLDVEARLSVLEERLMVESAGRSDAAASDDNFADAVESDESSDEDGEGGEDSQFVSLSKLQNHVQQYRLVQKSSEGIGSDHPFIIAQEARMMKVRNTLLLDLSTALKQAKSAGVDGLDRVMKIISIYREMDEAREAVKVLKGLKN
ncbi:hypothetical protein K432DRAFT_425313 [Lepidopterella palustris CBS 459.81]|uniref:Conserved oligomeric Golgi complex subunit 2 n=1 Tax=Lepidopterella palustris CBS 459.81 TaxID=1314670 RepID=A0A8E2EC34_9PEZI|nr:hypothetical protein K432DRAFT_425313 [Lepidopterella palustris CBS 459.81]